MTYGFVIDFPTVWLAGTSLGATGQGMLQPLYTQVDVNIRQNEGCEDDCAAESGKTYNPIAL